jgi:hypothetical protein
VPPEQLEGGDPQEAFFRVTVLEEELRVMAPDLGAIQVIFVCSTDRCSVWCRVTCNGPISCHGKCVRDIINAGHCGTEPRSNAGEVW